MERVSKIQMIDFHSHIIWDIDDGSKDFRMSSDMIENSICQNVQCICATPHFIIDEQEIDKKVYHEKLNALKESYSNKINILSGIEVYINPNIPKYYKEKKIWGMNDSRYVLIELPMRDYPIYTKDVFYELIILGAKPIIAHPERNLKIQQNMNLLTDLLNEGALAQMNAGSLTGMFGNHVKEFAEKLIRTNRIHMIGSDGHNNRSRKTDMLSAYETVGKLNKDLYQWMEENTNKIVKDIDVTPLKIVEDKQKKFNILNLFNRKK